MVVAEELAAAILLLAAAVRDGGMAASRSSRGSEGGRVLQHMMLEEVLITHTLSFIRQLTQPTS